MLYLGSRMRGNSFTQSRWAGNARQCHPENIQTKILGAYENQLFLIVPGSRLMPPCSGFALISAPVFYPAAMSHLKRASIPVKNKQTYLRLNRTDHLDFVAGVAGVFLYHMKD